MPILNKVAKEKLFKETMEMDRLHNVEGITYREIGRIYGISGQAVYSRLSKYNKSKKFRNTK